jgi:hypothetical protein
MRGAAGALAAKSPGDAPDVLSQELAVSGSG